MIVIVDYGAGNLASVRKAFEHLGLRVLIASDPESIARAPRLVLPGVGHFATTARLSRSGAAGAIGDAIARGVPFLGICVGMQWLFSGSDEAGATPGLGLLSGQCERFPAHVKSPHVGWNRVRIVQDSKLMRSARGESYAYFAHSYRAPLAPETVAEAEYGGSFSAAIESGNTFAVQFHPEKSGAFGLGLLRDFCRV